MTSDRATPEAAKSKSRFKLVFAGLLMAAFGLFMLQNREILELRFLFWKFETRRAYMLLVVFGSGLTIGWVVATISQLSARSRQGSKPSPRQNSRRS